MTKIIVKAEYTSYNEMNVELPEGKTNDDVTKVTIYRETGKVTFKDGSDMEFDAVIFGLDTETNKPECVRVWDGDFEYELDMK